MTKQAGIIGTVDEDEGDEMWFAYVDEAGNLVRVWQSSLEEARRRSMEEHTRTEERFRSAPFPLFGLPPSWTGRRFLGGGAWGGAPEQERTHALSLVHGTLVQGEGPSLTVETASEAYIGGSALLTAAGMVWQGRWGTIEEAFQELKRDHPKMDLPDAFPARTELRFEVDAVPTLFDAFVDAVEWVAQAEVGANVVTITADTFDRSEVTLVRITDIEPYVLGSRRFLGG